jgi:hypothetical protein
MKFRHCLAVTTFGPCTFMIDPLYHCVEYGFTNEAPLIDALVKLRTLGHEILYLDCNPDFTRPPRRSPFMTCATLLAYTCGIPSRAVTPDGLYRDILKLGGEKLQ